MKIYEICYQIKKAVGPHASCHFATVVTTGDQDHAHELLMKEKGIERKDILTTYLMNSTGDVLVYV